MTVTPLPLVPGTNGAFQADTPLEQNGGSAVDFGNAFSAALNDASRAFSRAADAESAFVHGRGGLQELVLERAQADVVLAIATSATSRAAQSLSTIVNMQV
ncbi:MAG: flagellar hook-basal body complex protein FliE [Candidatus Eremiobacteraeota bacterium]|nr:flagellar hook-basal body complex protein FliE [Candidatus Eremiobacteraeota bacterium]MBV9647640.1 flagellar hook-basal body complex protein FliE [Candidatus Eremiobacteraeota bacterium]